MAINNQPLEEQEQEQPVRRHPVKVHQTWRVAQADSLHASAQRLRRELGKVDVVAFSNAFRDVSAAKELLDQSFWRQALGSAGKELECNPARHIELNHWLAKRQAATQRLMEAQFGRVENLPPQPRQSLTPAERIQAALASGELEWGGGTFRPDPPSVTLPEGETLADVLAEARYR